MSVSQNKKGLKELFEEHLQIIAEKTGVSAHLIISGLGVCFFFVFIGYFDFYITNIVGILYPAYASIKAIESTGGDDDKQWLTYWVVFALFSLIDLFSGFVLKFIPFYFFIKLVFLVFCFMPNIKGATLIYDKFLVKIFKKYERDLDGLVDNLGKTVDSTIDKGKNIVEENKGKIIGAGIEMIAKNK